MTLGADYTQDSSGFQIVHPQGRFAASNPFAYVISLDQSVGTTSATLILVRVESGGVESVVYSVPMTVSNPDFDQFANRFSTTDSIMDNSPAGTYKLEMSTGSTIVAQATFTYLG